MENLALSIENESVCLTIQGEALTFWTYTVKASGQRYAVAAPVFEVNGANLTAQLTDLHSVASPQRLANGSSEYCYQGTFAHDPDLMLDLVFRIAEDNPVVRFAYVLRSRATHTLTKSSGRDAVTYVGLSLADLPLVKDIHFSEFVEPVHSYCLAEHSLPERYFEDRLQVMGPMLCASDATHTLLVAYEHGSQVPDAFLQYHLSPERLVTLQATKGNYYAGQVIDPAHPYQTLWFQLAALQGDETALAAAYRSFVLYHQSLQAESRKPYIFYNTWNFQERNKWWNGQTYLASMQQERILEEIEIAHQLGIDVFVLDTGWYIKTGDWQVDTARFPDGLKTVKERLDQYGMKLGLWFDPGAAAVSSSAYREYTPYTKSWQGRHDQPWPIWETEESHHMCLVSPYSDRFADELIRLAREVGVTYFKWDAVHQYGCDDPHHWHGTEQNTAQECADCYAFLMIREMTRIVERLSEVIPEAIVDFDVTEGGRAVGLSFLSAGKYFLINNGPYYANYDIKIDYSKDFSNIFVYPGPARTWICRTPLSYDKWLPSVLFLTHYLPDDPPESQWLNLASLILGQNGIWGDLPAISAEGVECMSDILRRYKEVRDDITSSAPVRVGIVGGSPEIHEKISSKTGRGVVVVFSTIAGSYSYVTAHRVSATDWHNEGVVVTRDAQGRAKLEVAFEKPGVKIIFFSE